LQADPGRAGVSYDKEFIVCSLDLLSGLAEGLGSSIESLVSRSDLFDLLLLCCADEAPDIRQSALALLGDLAKACAVHLQPRLADFLNLAAKQLGHEAKENVSVANNACWAIGEVAVKVLLSDLTCIFALSKVVSICAACHFVHSFCQPKLLLLHFGANLLLTSALQVKQDIAPIVVNVISCLVPILSNTEVCSRV
jgi:hypothetical protein